MTLDDVMCHFSGLCAPKHRRRNGWGQVGNCPPTFRRGPPPKFSLVFFPQVYVTERLLVSLGLDMLTLNDSSVFECL